jgi:hypothetical protein
MASKLPAMRLTIPHYFDFGADRPRVGRRLVQPGAWDAARDTKGPFGLPETRAEWEAKAADPALAARARDIAAIVREQGARRVCSYGVGTGVLELGLSRAAPELELTCTDYAPRTVDRLRMLFTEASIVQHDLLADEPLDSDFHLLHRVDTEFPNPQLAAILARFHRPVLLVPSVLLTWRLVMREFLLRLKRPRATRAGWLRSEAAFRALWDDGIRTRDVTVGNARAFLLTRVGGQP